MNIILLSSKQSSATEQAILDQFPVPSFPEIRDVPADHPDASIYDRVQKLKKSVEIENPLSGKYPRVDAFLHGANWAATHIAEGLLGDLHQRDNERFSKACDEAFAKAETKPSCAPEPPTDCRSGETDQACEEPNEDASLLMRAFQSAKTHVQFVQEHCDTATASKHVGYEEIDGKVYCVTLTLTPAEVSK